MTELLIPAAAPQPRTGIAMVLPRVSSNALAGLMEALNAPGGSRTCLACGRRHQLRRSGQSLLAAARALIHLQPATTSELLSRYLITVVCRSDGEAHVRALLLQALANSSLHFQELNSRNIESIDRVEVCAIVIADQRTDGALEQVVDRLSLESQVTAARWKYETAAE